MDKKYFATTLGDLNAILADLDQLCQEKKEKYGDIGEDVKTAFKLSNELYTDLHEYDTSK